MIKSILLIFLVVVLNITNIFSQNTFKSSYNVEVGSNPVKVFTVAGMEGIQVICAGNDNNFNGTLEQGEELPSWWLIAKSENGYNAVKKLDFDDFLKFPFTPFRPGFDSANKIIYIPFNKIVKSYNLTKFELIDDQVANIDAQAIEFAGGHLLLSTTSGTDKIGALVVLNIASGQVLQTIKVGINMQESVYYRSANGISIGVLAVGPYNSDNSTIYYGAINHTFDFTLSDSVVVGNTANQLAYNNGKFYVTVNQSHTIKIIDVNTHEVQTLYTGTSGYNGPRETVVNGNFLYVTTYMGDVRVFDIRTGVLVDIFPAKDGVKGEGLTFIDNITFAVAEVSKPDYSVNNFISIYQRTDDHSFFTSYPVGKRPMWLYTDSANHILHTICAGYDENNDGILNQDDENPSWWTLNKVTKDKEKKLDFKFNELKMPFRPAIDKKNNVIYIPAKGVIKSYDLTNFQLIDGEVAFMDAVAIDYAGGHLLIAKKYDNVADSIVVLNLQSGQVLQKVYAGEDVKDVKYYPVISGNGQPGIGLAILTYKESLGQDVLMYGSIGHKVSFELEFSVPVGLQGSQIVYESTKNTLVVTSQQSGEVYIIDLATNITLKSIVGTNGNKGPKATQFNSPDYYWTVTNNCDLRKIGSTTGEIFDIIPAPGQLEYINIANSAEMLNVTVASPYKLNGEVNNMVYALEQQPASVQEYATGSIAEIKTYPNPTTDFINIEIKSAITGNNLNIDLFDINGNSVYQQAVSVTGTNIFSIDMSKFSTGKYFVRLSNGSEIWSVPVNVVK